MPWFRLKSGFGEQFNLRGTVFCVGEPLLVEDASLAAKCRTLGYFDEVEPVPDEVVAKASPSLFDSLRSGLHEAASIANGATTGNDSAPIVMREGDGTPGPFDPRPLSAHGKSPKKRRR